MDKFPLQKRLLNVFRYDNSPVFLLNKTRRKYRNRFIALINSNQIRLKKISKCPCGNTELLKIAEKDRFGLPFSTFACSQCGLLITSPRILEDDISKYYKLIYHPLIVGTEKGEVSETYSFSSDQGEKIFEFTAPFLANQTTPMQILEIGCADGYGLSAFAQSAKKRSIECQLYGTEFENHLKSAATERGIQILDDDIRSLKQKEFKFDLIIMSHVFEHMTDLHGTLNGLSSLLSEKGLLYIEVPGVMNLSMMNQWYNSDFLDYIVHAHLYQFNLKSLQNILSLNGFNLLRGDEIVRTLCTKSVSHQNPASVTDQNCEEVLNFLHNTFVKKDQSTQSFLRRIYSAITLILNRIYYPVFQEKPDLSRFSYR